MQKATHELFRIENIIMKQGNKSLVKWLGYPDTFISYNDEEIKGSFYEQELQKATQELFRIEKILKKKGSKSLVKWVGYPDKFNSWVDNSDLVAL